MRSRSSHRGSCDGVKGGGFLPRCQIFAALPKSKARKRVVVLDAGMISQVFAIALSMAHAVSGRATSLWSVMKSSALRL